MRAALTPARWQPKGLRQAVDQSLQLPLLVGSAIRWVNLPIRTHLVGAAIQGEPGLDTRDSLHRRREPGRFASSSS